MLKRKYLKQNNSFCFNLGFFLPTKSPTVRSPRMVQGHKDRIRIQDLPATQAVILGILTHKFLATRKLLLLQPCTHSHIHKQDKAERQRLEPTTFSPIYHESKTVSNNPQKDPPPPPTFISQWPKLLHLISQVSKEDRNEHVQFSLFLKKKK